MPGYPIRTSSDPRSVDNSPRHIAASHVLHRLSMPRHPPCALHHLQTQKPTIKNRKLHKTNTPPRRAAHSFRCSQPLSNKQTPHPTTKRGDNTRCCLRTQQCAGDLAVHKDELLLCTRSPPTTDDNPFTARVRHSALTLFVVLLRKEVIQPHLPVRLPCYDFVPIADPTFDSSPHKG